MMRIIFAFLLLSSLFTQKDLIVIQSDEFRQIPKRVQGGSLVAANPPTVDTIVLEGLPEGEGALWSSWGDGCFASNGKYYTAVGDHRGYDGNSYIYEYDPAARTLTRIVNVAETIGQKSGEYGHGKIHAQMQEHKGGLYFATYWGKQGEVEGAYKKGYKGSLLFRYDLRSRALENLGVIAPRKGLPGSILDPNRELLYFYAVEGEKGDVAVYDLKNRIMKFQGGSQYTVDHRTFMLAKDGRVYFSDGKGKLSFYDPDKNAISSTALTLPGPENRLRAAAAATLSGIIFGMTRGGRLFAFDPAKETIKDLGPNFLAGDYNAAMVLSPDQKYLYFAPGSHGSAVNYGVPVVQYDIAKGTRKVIAFLQQPLLKKAGYSVAGNYNMQTDPKGAILYCTFNGSKFVPGKDPQKFGLPAVVVIKIPETERK